MEFTLRPAARSDALAIRLLIWRARINPMNLNWHRFVVAVDPQEKLLGCGQIKPHSDGSRELASIATQLHARGQGVAHAIITRLLEQSAPPLYLTCAARLEGFYRRFGFKVLLPAEMPPDLRRRWQQVEWFRRRLAPEKTWMLVMGLG
jgi:N-acetylglutamate synthase-like GNAT family acetyltransferase